MGLLRPHCVSWLIQVTHFPTTSSPQLHWTRESTTSHPARRESPVPLDQMAHPVLPRCRSRPIGSDFCIWSCALAQYQPLRGSSTFGLEGTPVAPSRPIEQYIPLPSADDQSIHSAPMGQSVSFWTSALFGPPVALDTRLSSAGPKKHASPFPMDRL